LRAFGTEACGGCGSRAIGGVSHPILSLKIRRILVVSNRIREPGEMAVYPGWRLHRLTGDRAGFWSVTVTGNRQIAFRFEQERALDVDLIDYH
jgi:proteic killer suppression protein